MTKLFTLVVCLMWSLVAIAQYSGAGPVTMTTPSGATGIQWFEETLGGGVAIPGETNASLVTSVAGAYYAVFTSSDLTCTDPQRTVLSIVANHASTVILNGSANNAGATAYQWNNGGTAISGATSSNHTVTEGGSYSLDITLPVCTVSTDFFVFYLSESTSPNGDSDGDGVANAIDTAPNNPCLPVQQSGYTSYDASNSIWASADCDGDGIINGTEVTDLTDPYDDCSSIGGTPSPAGDCDGDGNPNGTDPNPQTATTIGDAFTATFGNATTNNILANDDFLPSSSLTLSNLGTGSALGTVVLDATTGEITYTPTAAEQGTNVTVMYRVCQGTVCAEATVTITVPAQLPPDYSPNYTFVKTVFKANEAINFITNINELSNRSTIGTLSVFIPEIVGFTVSYDETLSTLEVGGIMETIDNSDWIRDTSITTGLLLQNSTGVTPNGRSRIGITITPAVIGSAANLTTTVQATTGGDSNNNNNTGALKLSTTSN